jgi:hypothetical protein
VWWRRVQSYEDQDPAVLRRYAFLEGLIPEAVRPWLLRRAVPTTGFGRSASGLPGHGGPLPRTRRARAQLTCAEDGLTGALWRARKRPRQAPEPEAAIDR